MVGLGNVTNVAQLSNTQTLAHTGDVTAPATALNAGTIALTLATITDSGTGSFKKITTNTKGLVTGTTAVAQADITGLLGAGSITNTMLANGAVSNLIGINTGDETATTIKTKLGITTLSGSNTGDQTTITGNAGTATKLATVVNINGVPFDGSAAITINAVDSTARVASSLLGTVSGVATLDASGKLTTAQIPAALVGALQYQGVWNASTNSPALVSSTGTKGQYYKVSVAGTTTIDTIAQWNVGDMIVFDGTTWDKIDGLSSEVTSVAGRVGAVTLAQADIAGLTTTSSPTFTAVTATTFTGILSGNATTATNVAYSGLTGTVPIWNQNTTGTAAGLSATLAVISGGTGVTTSTGTGSNVLSTSPTLVTPILGTPTSGTLTNCTFPILNQNTTGTASNITAYTINQSVGIGNDVQHNSLGLGTSAPGSGALYATGNITAFSDQRLKENIKLIPNSLEKVKSLRGVTFTRNDKKDKTKSYAGVIAQEVIAVLPEVVFENSEGIYSVDYGNMVGLLIEAIKDLSKEIDILKQNSL